MKVLHVITNLEVGGAEKLLVDLLPRIADTSVVVELAIFVSTDTPFYRALKASGIKIYEFSHQGSVYNIVNLIKLARLASKYDVIHTHNTAPQLFGAITSIIKRVKWVSTEHTTTNNHRVWWFLPIEKWMYNRYDHVICISEAVRQNMHIVAGSKVASSVIYNGIDTQKYSQALAVDKSKISSAHNHKVLIMVGRMSYQKDQATIIRAITEVRHDVELWLVGDGEKEKELKVLTQELGLEDKVRFLGRRTDIPELLKAADIAIQSSHIEGFGLAAVEAMAAGLPVIASNIPGLSQVVNGAGLLFQHENYQELSMIINSLLDNNDKYEQAAKASVLRASKYDIETMAQKYIDVYKQIVENERI